MTRNHTHTLDVSKIKRTAETVYREDVALTIEIDATSLTVPVNLVVLGDRGKFTTIIDPDPAKPFGKAIDEATVAVPKEPKSWVIYPKSQAHIMCNAERFHQIVTELTELDVRGFDAWYNETQGAYHIKLNSFTTTIEPIVLAYNLNLIYSGFSEFDALEVKNNG